MNFEELQKIKEKYIAEVNFRKNADTSGVEDMFDIIFFLLVANIILPAAS